MPQQEIIKNCTECMACVKNCRFLKEYGTPKALAERDDLPADLPFECSLCGLCGAVCPEKLDPAAMFLEMRQTRARQGFDFARHKPLLAYERRGTSRRYSYYGLPEGCDTVLFPGCALAGTRPKRVLQLYDFLSRNTKNLGIVLDCCTKPSHDLGREDFFKAMFGEMRDYLQENGVKEVLVTCPSCLAVFKKYGQGLAATTIYDKILTPGPEWTAAPGAKVAVQDSCTARYEFGLQKTIRQLLKDKGIEIKELKHKGGKTRCCGEGGGVGFINRKLARAWAANRIKQAEGRMLATYCAGCANFLKKAPSVHVLDLIFDPQGALAGKVKGSGPPFTYLNRLLLKRKFKKKFRAAISRERDFQG